ncbi:hypothetical protein H8B15_11485 [Hymenobacter sp. BT507]|uniref:Secretin/TonB short N-terminal domain-containing protein n=1 Tax=Hymenobacter citatus TaxID=2763506 RepID=A0ABR7MKE2_9BACT|nr:STN domain-containing protein [Hymenobacter citatus]MBC6611551.1 hypothetical protein [Hymenobacter citatus]
MPVRGVESWIFDLFKGIFVPQSTSNGHALPKSKNMNTKHVVFLLSLGVFTGSSISTSAQNSCKTTPAAVRITAGSLDKALTDLAKQLGCPVHYDKKIAQQFRSPAVQGTFTPTDALIRIVQGTGLEAHVDRNGLEVSRVDQAAIGLRVATLQAQLGQAVKSQQLTQNTANTLYSELGEVRTSVVELAKKQGFVSAAEKASYQRTFAKAEQALAQPNQPK